jgi:hypothetical protein
MNGSVCILCDVSCRKEIQGGIYYVCPKVNKYILAATNHTRVSSTHTSARISHAP